MDRAEGCFVRRRRGVHAAGAQRDKSERFFECGNGMRLLDIVLETLIEYGVY